MPFSFDDILRLPEKARTLIEQDNKMIAALSGAAVDIPALREALKAGANPDRAVNGIPVLHLAIYRRSIDAFKMLLASGAEVEDAVDRDGLNAIDVLYKTGWAQGLLETDKSVFKRHGKRYKENPASPAISTGEMPESESVEEKSPENSNGNSPGISTYEHKLSREWKSAIFDDVYEGENFWRVRTLIALGADVNAEYEETPPLRHAISSLSPEVCRILINAGAIADHPHNAFCLWHFLSVYRSFNNPRWLECYDILEKANGMPFVLPRPDRMTLEDMRAPFPKPMYGSFLQFFTRNGCFLEILQRLKQHPEERLHPKELYAPRPDGRTIIDFLGKEQHRHLYDISIWREDFSALQAFRAEMVKRGWHTPECEQAFVGVSEQSLAMAREKLKKTGNRYKMKPV